MTKKIELQDKKYCNFDKNKNKDASLGLFPTIRGQLWAICQILAELQSQEVILGTILHQIENLRGKSDFFF